MLRQPGGGPCERPWRGYTLSARPSQGEQGLVRGKLPSEGFVLAGRIAAEPRMRSALS
jgi:hypothetical protein